MKPTIYDVAKEANVSIATVSKVLNKSGRISDETRKRVLKVIEQLNYQPSMMATALTGKSTFTIGLLIPDLANPFFAELARSIEDRGHELGYNIFICSTDYQVAKEKNYIDLLKRKSVDGLILASGFEDTTEVEKLIQEKFPVAIVARDSFSPQVNSVTIDNFHGGYEAASYLIRLGHTRIAMIARNVWSNRERLRGYRQALNDHNLEECVPFEFTKESDIESGKKVAENYLRSKTRPTAIFAGNDLLAIGAIQTAREMGIKVPDQLSVVGFDNTAIATLVNPRLTTMAQPIKMIGQEVMDLMVEEIEKNGQNKKKIVLSPELVVRESTAEPKL